MNWKHRIIAPFTLTLILAGCGAQSRLGPPSGMSASNPSTSTSGSPPLTATATEGTTASGGATGSLGTCPNGHPAAGAAAAAQAGQIVEYAIPSADSGPQGITTGPDGRLWFTEANRSAGNQIGRLTPAGGFAEFPIPGDVPGNIVAGPDGRLWFGEEYLGSFGRVSTDGVVVDRLRTPYQPDGMTVMGRKVWFTELNGKVAAMDTSGSVQEYPIPTPTPNAFWITAGPDGDLWFTETAGNRVGRITPAGDISEFPLPTRDSKPGGIACGPDGNLWFTESTGKIGRITPAGIVTEFAVPGDPFAVAAGADGNLWFTEEMTNMIGRITPAGAVTRYGVPTAGSQPRAITQGPDGNLWFVEWAGNKVGKVVVGAG